MRTKEGLEMAGKVCAFEKEHGVHVPRDKFVDDAIETAIKAEQKEEMVYADAAARAANYHVKDLLAWLATEEERHAETLTGLKDCLKSAGRWVAGAHEIEDRPPLPVVPKGERQSVSKDELRVLIAAMNAEKKSIDYYHGLAKKARHAGAKTFFKKMADYEQEHYDKLDSLFENLSKLEPATQTI
ncbi:MAG: ferritin family protein [Candidatus Micrarchaeota archaeon]